LSVTAIAASLEIDMVRLRSEFMSYPGMCLSVEQVARLLDVPHGEAAQALSALEDEGLLLRGANGTYRRASPLLS
jgi:predicted transcriptional regulator of viral defense system